MGDLIVSFEQKFAVFGAWLSNPITLLLVLPLLGCLLVSVSPRDNLRRIRALALTFTALPLLVATLMLTGLPQALLNIPAFAGFTPFSPAAGFQFGLPVDAYRWLTVTFGEQSFTVNYNVGVDGISMPLVVMTCAIFFLCALWGMKRSERLREYFALFLLLQTGILGVFCALDYVLFYLFWELMLIPMYFLIAGWGKDKARAQRAAIKFFIFTLTGSVFYLIAFIGMHIFSGVLSFSILDIARASMSGNMAFLPMSVRMLMFCGLLLGFAVKVPMFPFHTWLPDAHTEAPTEMSVILAALMLKTGAYAFIRILYSSLPDVAYQAGPVIAACGVIAIIYGGAITLMQTDFKRMVAYSSISHMGFIVLGISAMNNDALTGAVYHMIGHGVIIAALFFLSGAIEERYGTRDLRQLGAMLQLAPSYAVVLAVSAFAAMGFPLAMGFWGEFLILKGTFYNNPNWQSVHVLWTDGSTFLMWCAVAAVLGILISAVYMLNMLTRVFGPLALPVLVPGRPGTIAGQVAVAGQELTPVAAASLPPSSMALAMAGPPTSLATSIDERPAFPPVELEYEPAPALDASGQPMVPWRGFKPNHRVALVALTAAMLLFFFWPAPILNSVQAPASELYKIFLSK